jgi:hypothetical protein
MHISKVFILSSLLATSSNTIHAFSIVNHHHPSSLLAIHSQNTALSATPSGLSRENFLQHTFGAAGIVSIGSFLNPLVSYAEDGQQVTLPSGTSYVVVKSGDGPQPKIGELAGIRFRAEVLQTGNKIDDIFDTPEPYYTRVGSGGLLKVGCLLLLLFYHTVLYILPIHALWRMGIFLYHSMTMTLTFSATCIFTGCRRSASWHACWR